MPTALVALRTADGELAISDERMRTALDRHLKGMDERELDVQMTSPRPVAMTHREGVIEQMDFLTTEDKLKILRESAVRAFPLRRVN